MANTVELTLKARDEASQVIRGVMGSISGMMGQLAGLAGLAGAGLGLGALVKQGIEFNKTMEDSKGGIAGVLLMTREYVDATGRVVTGQKAMDAAFAESSVIQEKLKKDALGTAASYTELVGAFQTALAPAAAAGVTNLDDVREITVMATQAMAALNIPTAQAAQELRGLFAGDMGPDNRLNQILRVSKEDLKALGGDAEKTAAFFREKLGPAASAAAMQTGTLTVRLSNMGDILDQVMGDATAGLFKEISGLVAEMTGAIEDNRGILADLGDTIRVAFGVVKETIADVFGTADASLKAHGLTWRDFLFGLSVLFVGFVESVGSGMKYITQFLTAPIETIRGLWKTLIGGLSSLLAEFLRTMADTPVIGKLFKGASESLDRFVVSLTTGDAAFDRFQKKAERNWGEGAFSNARKMMEDYGKATDDAGKKLDGLGSRAKTAGEDVAKTTEAMTKAFLKAAKEQGRTWMALVQTPLEKSLAFFRTGEAAVEEFIGVLQAKREQWQKAVSDIFTFRPDDASAGAKAGLYGVFAALPSAAESAATAVQDVWAGMARAFDDVFFSVLTGKLDSLKDVFKNLWESILQTASRYFSDLLQRWLATQMQMGQTPAEGSYPGLTSLPGGASQGMFGNSTGWGSMGAGYSNGGGLNGALAGAGVGLGVGSIVGSLGNGKYNQTGGQLGGMIGGAIFGVVGAVVGALIGALIGAIASPNTERHVRGAFDNMLGNVTGKWVGKKGGGPDDGEWVTGIGGPTSDLERDARDAFEEQGGRFFDLLRLGAKDKAAELFAAYQKTLRDSLKGARIDIAAGSEGHIQQDIETFLTKMLPRLTLSAMFGQTGNLPAFDRDAPGGIPGIDWNAPSLDLAKKLFDPDAPIPSMLRDLGVGAERIAELAAKIPTEDPEKLLKYIEGLVGVLVEFKRLGTAMGKTIEETWAGFDAEAKKTAAGSFGEAAQDIADLFDVLDTYSGDVQMEKAKEALALSDEFWRGVEQYLRQLQAAMEKMSTSLQGQRVAMRDFLNPLGPDETATNAWGAAGGVWGKLRNATDPGQVEEAIAEAQAAIDKVFRVMAERVTRGKALLERLGDAISGLGSLGADLAFEALERENPLKAWGQALVGIQGDVAAAAKKSGLDQIAAIEDVAGAGEEMAANLKSFIADIASTSSGISKSIEQQKWELRTGELDPQGQATAVMQRVRDLQEQLKLATSPAEIQSITSEIQSLTNRYVGQFGKDDPKRQEAIDWATEQLDRANGLAQETLAALKKQAEAFAAQLEKTLTDASGLISKNVTDASTMIGQLSHTLGELDRVMRETMERLGQGVLDSLEPLRTAMDGAADIFKGATQTAANGLTAPNTGLADSTDRAAASARAFADALDRATQKLNGGQQVTQGERTVVVQQPASTQRVTAAEVVPMLRRYSGQTLARVG